MEVERFGASRDILVQPSACFPTQDYRPSDEFIYLKANQDCLNISLSDRDIEQVFSRKFKFQVSDLIHLSRTSDTLRLRRALTEFIVDEFNNEDRIYKEPDSFIYAFLDKNNIKYQRGSNPYELTLRCFSTKPTSLHVSLITQFINWSLTLASNLSKAHKLDQNIQTLLSELEHFESDASILYAN